MEASNMRRGAGSSPLRLLALDLEVATLWIRSNIPVHIATPSRHGGRIFTMTVQEAGSRGNRYHLREHLPGFRHDFVVHGLIMETYRPRFN